MTEHEDEKTTEIQPEQPEPAKGPRRLLRSRDDRVIAGVAGGLGRYFDIDPVIVRPSGASMTCGSTKPARALMLADYLISEEAQEVIVDTGRTPSNTNIKGGVLSSGPHNPIYEDMEKIANEQEATKWSEVWDGITNTQ